MDRNSGVTWVLLTAWGALCLMGCQGANAPAKKPFPTPEAKEPAQRIGTGGISVLSRDKERQNVWKANAVMAQVKVEQDGAVSAQMRGVSGDVYQDGTPAAKFKAEKGFADQKSQALRLQDQIVLSNSAGDAKVTSDRLEWLPTIKMVQLKGGVTYRGNGQIAGPMETIWVTPDLKELGTPHSFKNDPTMKALIAPLLATLAVAQGTFSDEKGNMRLTFTTWRATVISQTQTHFVATGSPASGTWASQGLNLRARTIEGEIRKASDGRYILTKGDLSGEVRTEMKQQDSAGTRSTILTSQRATFTGDEKTGNLALGGPLQVTSALANGSQWMQMTGTSGAFKLSIGQKQPLDSAEISGPVTLRLISKRKNQAGVLETTDLSATGRKLTFNSGIQEIELSGGVIVTGKGPDLIGKMEGERFRVILDPQGFVKEVYAEGNPGQAVGRQP